MINISDKFKTAMKEPIKELDAYVLLEDGTKITSGDDLISFKISGETLMCKTAMRKVECKYTGNYNLLDKWVRLFLGVKIDDGTFEYLDYGLFQINEMTSSKDTGETTVTGYDLMIKSMIEYSELDVTYPITLYDFANRLVKACGLELKNTSFIANNDFLINGELYSNISGITYRDIFVQIAEATGTTCIMSEDKVYFKPVFETNEELTYDNMFTLKLENKYGEINSIVLARTPQEDNIYLKDDESIELNGLTEFKIENNEIVDKDRETAIVDIYDQLSGISYYPFETTTEGLGCYEIADSFVIKNENDEEFRVVLFNFSISVDGSIKETLKTSETSSTKTQYQYATSIAKTVRNTELIVDKQNGEIKSIVDEIGDRTSKSTSITQDLDSISERVSLQQNLTNIVKKSSYVDTEDAYEGNLLYLSIHGQMSLLYPSDDLYPEEDLYPLDSYIIVEYSDNTRQKVKLPINWLNYLDDNTYDEFVLEENKAKIIRRVGENEDGSFYKLDTEVIEDYGDLVIPVKTGYNKLWLESFYDLELNYEIRYVIKSDYTDTFATEYYVDNSIDINNKGIILETKSYTDKETQGDALIAKINLDSTGNAKIDASKTIDLNGVDINLTSDNITINSTNFNVDKSGKVTATAGEIGGFNLTSTNFSNDIDGNYEYSYGDLLACHACILDCNEEEFGDAMGSKAFTSYYKNILDTSGDGVLNALDLLQIQKNIFEMYELSKNAKGKLLINSNSPKNCFSILDGNGDYSFQAGTTGATIREINAETIICASPDTYEDNVIIIKGYDGSILCDTLTCNILNQTSLSTVKKNFEKYTGALEEIENIDVYKYNLKSEEDTTKKHLGFVIGNDFNYSKVITNNDDTGVDIYSMTSLCLQAIKEQQQEIEKLKEEINSLKGGK